MVDPKKDYELLMRYLQRGATTKNPVSAPEPDLAEDWQPATQPVLSQTPTVATPSKSKVRTLPKFPTLHFPKLFKWSSLSFPKFWKLPALHLLKRPQISLHTKTRLVTAIVAISALVFILWKGYSFYQLSTDKIFNSLYVPFKPVITAATPATKTSIEAYYNTANFIAVTLQSKKQAQLTDKEKLLTGMAYMQRNDYSKAIKWLEQVANNFKSSYRQQAEFYVALAYLKNEDFDHSIEKLEKIRYNPSHLYYNKISENTISDIKMLKWR